MRLVRVMRILRIFKLVRHFAGLQSLLYTLKQAYKELGLLVILVAVAVLTFSSLVFYAEKDSPDLKWTFLDSFWWGLMTLTTGKHLVYLNKTKEHDYSDEKGYFQKQTSLIDQVKMFIEYGIVNYVPTSDANFS